MNRHTVIILTWFFIGISASTKKSPLLEKYSWPFVAYDYDDMKKESDDIRDGSYESTKNIMVDVEPVPDGRIFVTIKRDDGVPATLGTISERSGPGGIPLVKPYPSWIEADSNNCSNVIGALRMTQDRCNRLWVLDSGKYGSTQICPPKLVAFDLLTNKVHKQIEIPIAVATDSRGSGRLSNLAVPKSGCIIDTIYIADVAGGAMIIYNEEKFTRVESPNFMPDKLASTFTLNGTVYVEGLGLTGLTLTGDGSKVEDSRLYFRPIASYDMYYVNTVNLLANMNDSVEYITEPAQLPSQTAVIVLSQAEIMFFADMTECSILCWNTRKPFISSNIVTVAQNNDALQWVSGLKIISGAPSSESLWIMSNRYQAYQTHTMDFNNTNFRILVGLVEELVRGTNCDIK